MLPGGIVTEKSVTGNLLKSMYLHASEAVIIVGMHSSEQTGVRDRSALETSLLRRTEIIFRALLAFHAKLWKNVQGFRKCTFVPLGFVPSGLQPKPWNIALN